MDFESFLKDIIGKDYNAGRSQPVNIVKLRVQSSSDSQSFVTFPAVPSEQVSAFVAKRFDRKNRKLSLLVFINE